NAFRPGNPAYSLCEKLVLATEGLGEHRRSMTYRPDPGYYPDTSLHPAVKRFAEPAESLPWVPSRPCSSATPTYRRRPAEITLELWATYQALQASGSWRVTVPGMPQKATQTRLRKAVPADETDPILPPDHESLYYRLLLDVGAITTDATEGTVSEV